MQSRKRPTTGQWPGFVHLGEDELLASWLVRTAHAHGLTLSDFVRSTNPDLFRNVSQYRIRLNWVAENQPALLLKSITLGSSISWEQAMAATFASYAPLLTICCDPPPAWLLSTKQYKNADKTFGQMYCPGCLRNDGTRPYFRRHWRLALSIVCADCGVYLHDCCPNCQAPVVFYRDYLFSRPDKKFAFSSQLIGQCMICQVELNKAIGILAPADVVIAQRRLLERIRPENIMSYEPYFTALRYIATALCDPRNWQLIPQAWSPDTPLSDLLPLYPFNRYKRAFERLRIGARAPILQLAYHLAEAGVRWYKGKFGLPKNRFERHYSMGIDALY